MQVHETLQPPPQAPLSVGKWLAREYLYNKFDTNDS